MSTLDEPIRTLDATPKWKDFTGEQKQYLRELRKEGWSLCEAMIQAACCGGAA